MNVSLLEHIEFFMFLSWYCRLLISVVGTVFLGPILSAWESQRPWIFRPWFLLPAVWASSHSWVSEFRTCFRTSDPLLVADGITPISNCQPYIYLFILDFQRSSLHTMATCVFFKYRYFFPNLCLVYYFLSHVTWSAEVFNFIKSNLPDFIQISKFR